MREGNIQMQHTGKWILGTAAIALTLGAVQFASGHDLAGRLQANAIVSANVSATGINRDAKADRGARLATSVPQTRTISLTLNGLSDTSVLLRIPAAGVAQRGLSAPIKSGGRATAVACEPMVSVLTEVARQLGPGRCVT